MNYVAFLIMRRLRAPLITLIVIWSIATLGYVIIPGQDNDGNAVRMDFLHAFYFVSYMGTTIGFGEIPYAFTPAQRLWSLFTIYGTVIGWFYSIGALVTIFRDQSLLNLVRRTRFSYRVARIREPFYLVCGYGHTGSALVADLAEHGVQTVVVDIDPQRIEALELDGHPFDIPVICANASDPDVLRDAGIEHPRCQGVLCLTNDDHVNLYVAIASKLLAPERVVISRVSTREYAANLASFGTDHIIDPFETFADYLTNAIVSPFHQLVYNWLASPVHRSLDSAHRTRQGRWIICGYGRLGKALQKRFDVHGLKSVIIEPDPEAREVSEDYHVVTGWGTEAATLLEADIRNSVGIVAGTPDDANNLSIVMTARELKPSIYTVARQNRQSNGPIFKAAKMDQIMNPSVIIAQRIMFLIKTPLLMLFLDSLTNESEEWCETLLKRIDAMVQGRAVESWSFTIDQQQAPAVFECLRRAEPVAIQVLSAHPHDRHVQLPALPLLVLRDKVITLLPEPDFPLRIDDQVLFCGLERGRTQMLWAVNNQNVLRYVISGYEGGGGYLWKTLLGRHRARP
jgi:Trk K+ transport system NAD-binding subunit